MSDSQFLAPSLHNPAKNRTLVKIGEGKPVLDVEFNELQEIQNHLRAEIVRQMTHSGVLDINSVVSLSSASTESRRGLPIIYNLTPNYIMLSQMDTIINGYKITVKDFARQSLVNNLNDINLPEPPTFGTREDLVFLEAWFENVDSVKDPSIIDSRIGAETSRRVELKWRIRTVAGVDFNRYLDGLSGGQTIDTTPLNIVTSQGGNDSPLNVSVSKTYNQFYSYLERKGTSAMGKKVSIDDVGLYLAGTGDQASKDTLKTADGYVYAIPLFRVKRRNSGGYREDNLNGARDYFSVTLNIGNSPALASNETRQITVDEDSYNKLKVNDLLSLTSNTSVNVTVISKDGSNKITIRNNYTVSSIGGVHPYHLSSDRPDGKFSNIIDKDDIIDLRHKVSLTGFNYQQLLEENFDKLLRGELQTKDKPVVKKEKFGLTPAPLGLQAQLMPMRVKGTDGVARDLTNLIGSDFTDYDSNGIADEWTAVLYGATASIVTANSGRKAQRLASNNTDTATARRIQKKFPVANGKFYIFISNLETDGTGLGGMAIVNSAENQTFFSAPNSNVSKFMYNKYAHINSDTEAILRLFNYTPLGQVNWVQFDSVRLYEIDQATYDKIDVDPEFTGEKLAGKFPYVSSYPNVVENIFDGALEAGHYTTTGAVTKVSSSSTRTVNDIKVKPSTKYYFKRSNSVGDCWGVYKDSSGNAISATHLNGVTSFTTPSNVVSMVIYQLVTDLNMKFFIGEYGVVDFIPYGRWLLPYDYANGETPNRFVDYYGGGRTILSDAQTTENITEVIESLKTPQRHITVTQATEGRWTANDTIKIKSVDGVITGVIDSDTALATVVETGSATSIIKIDDVSKLAVNDKVRYWVPSSNVFGSVDYTITAIDSVNKTITIDASISPTQGALFTEVTASTSSPVTTATGLVGTWSGLGTKEATFTVTTKPTTDTDNIKLQYSIVYPSGKGIQQVPTEVLEAKVNGEKLVKATDNIVRIKANFDGKVTGNTDLTPHLVKFSNGTNTSLLVPSASQFLEASQVRYGDVGKLGGSSWAHSPTLSNENIAQHLFSFDIIRAITDKLGENVFADCLTLADKVAKAKAIISKITGNWWGYGSSPSGSKAYFRHYSISSSQWIDSGSQTSSSVITKLLVSRIDDENIIDANGFVYFLAYAEPSDGVTASVITSDYVELELELNIAETGYDVFVPENQLPVLVDSSSEFKEGENMIPPFTDSRWSIHANAKVVGDYELELNATSSWNNSYIELPILPNSAFTLNSINVGYMERSFLDSTGSTISGSSVEVTTVPYTFASPPNAYKIRIILSSKLAGTFNFKNPSLTVGDKRNPFVPYSKNVKRKKKLDFRGKVAGSTFENPHNYKELTSTSLTVAPTSGTWLNRSQANYDGISKLDGNLQSRSALVATEYPLHLFEFDLSHLGLSLSELKSALRKLTINWTGYGSGDNAGVKTFGAKVKVFANNVWNDIGNNQSNAPSLVTVGSTTSSPTWVTNDQKVYVLVHSTYPASATIPSEIFTDYVKLEVELADYVDYVPATPVKVRKETKEVKLQYPMKSNRFGTNGELELTYRFIPYQGFIDTTTFTVLTNMDKAYATSHSTKKYKAFSSSWIPYTELLPISNKSAVIEDMKPLISGVGHALADVFRPVNIVGRNHISTAKYRQIKAGTKTGINSSGIMTTVNQYCVINEPTLDSTALIVMPCLVELNGKLFMLIYSTLAKHGVTPSSDNTVNDLIHLFELEGKLLVKGVN